MLKVWKDSSHPSSRQNRELGEMGIDGATAPSSPGLAPELEVNTVSLKRARQSSSQDGDTHSIQSSKRAKVSASTHKNHCSSTAFASASADELLEFAKTRNGELFGTSE